MRNVMGLGPSLRWHRGRLATRLRRPGFGSIGEGTVIVRPLVLRGTDRIHLGPRCAIYEDVWLQCEDVPGARIDVGADAYIGHRVHLHSGSPITIGASCWITDETYVGSLDHDRNDRTQVVATGAIVIGDRVFLGQRSVVLGGVTIGDDATIGAGAVVTHDVPAGAVAVGVPARVLPARADQGARE